MVKATLIKPIISEIMPSHCALSSAPNNMKDSSGCSLGFEAECPERGTYKCTTAILLHEAVKVLLHETEPSAVNNWLKVLLDDDWDSS